VVHDQRVQANAGARASGFRVEPSRFHWAVVEGLKTAPTLVEADCYACPVGESEAQALSSFRRETKDLHERFQAQDDWVRAAEHSIGKRTLLMRRCRIEGVIIATLDALGVRVKIGSLGTMPF
jgi:hypothetical protein